MATAGVAGGTAEEALRHGSRLLRADPRAAAAQAREILSAQPGNADAYRLLGEALRAAGEDEAAEQAELEAINASVRDPMLIKAGEAQVASSLRRHRPASMAGAAMEIAGRAVWTSSR